MQHRCTTTQIGRIGKLTKRGANLMISVASDRGYMKDGIWVERTNWLEYTVFAGREGQMNWIENNLKPGDLVDVTATPGQTSWTDKNGETQYGVTFALEEITRLARPSEKTGDDTAKPAKKTRK